MHANFSVHQPLEIRAFSLPPHETDRGKPADPSITVYLTGESAYQEPSVNMSLSLDEAQDLADTLSQLVAGARANSFSKEGHELLAYHDEKAAAHYAKRAAEK